MSNSDADERDVAMRIMNERFAVVNGRIFGMKVDARGGWEITTLTREQLRVECANRFVKDEDGDSITWDELWLKDRSRREYSRIIFDPTREPGDYKLFYGGEFNIWRGFAFEPSEEGSCELFAQHLRDNVCGGDNAAFTWLWAWLADLFQKPASPCGTSVILRGNPGTGKTTCGLVFGELLSPHHLLADSVEQVLDRHNTLIEQTLLVQVDEAAFGGDPRLQGRFNHLVTAPTLLLNPKHLPPYRAKNYNRLLLTAGRDAIIPVSLDDRRCAVFDVGDGWQNDSYEFGRMWQELRRDDGQGFARLLHELLAADTSGVNLRRPPRTIARTRLQVASLRPGSVDRWWYERLVEGAQMRGGDWITAPLPRKDIYNSYIAHNDLIRSKEQRELESILGMRLKFLCPNMRSVRPAMSVRNEQGETVKRRIRCYEFPPLPVARSLFEKAMDSTLDWPVENDDIPL